MDLPQTRPITRRSFLAAGLAEGLGSALAGCGDDGGGGATTAGAAAGDFPLTMRHRFGTTTIPARPERVVTAGFNDADFALAVGVVPVGVADFIGPYAEERRPWAQEALGGAEPEKVSGESGELHFERIAALRPDVIVFYNYLDDSVYRRLSAIAPTVVAPKEGTLWRRHTIDVGRALGREAQAREAVAGVDDRFATERSAHPEFEGTTAAILFGVESGADYYLLESTDARTGLFTSLGFTMPRVTGEISRERADLLDQDLIVVVGTEREALEDDRLFRGLDAVREGRVAYLGGFDEQFAGALGFDSPLSLPAALDVAVPAMARALASS